MPTKGNGGGKKSYYEGGRYESEDVRHGSTKKSNWATEYNSEAPDRDEKRDAEDEDSTPEVENDTNSSVDQGY